MYMHILMCNLRIFLEKYCCFPFSGVRVSYASGSELKHVLSATHSHLNTPQLTSTPSELWCTGTPVGEEDRQTGRRRGWGVGTVREIHTTETRPREGRRSSKESGVDGGMGKRKRGLLERGRHEEWVTEWVKSWRRVGKDGGGCFLSPFLPAHIDSPRKKERRRISGRTAGHMTFSLGPLLFLHAEWWAPSLPSRSLPLSLPSPALQSFDMSSPTTKTEVGRLAGATAASGCLALKLPANTAGRGGGRGRRRREKTEKERQKAGGKEEGDRDRKLKRKTQREALSRMACIKQSS